MKEKKQALKRVFSIILMITLSFGAMSCYGEKASEETIEKKKVFTKTIDDSQLELGKALTNPNGIDEAAVEAILKRIKDARTAYDDLKDGGASWLDIGKGAMGGIMGRTLVHGVRSVISLYLPGPIGMGLTWGLSLLLGGSGTGRKEEDKPDIK